MNQPERQYIIHPAFDLAEQIHTCLLVTEALDGDAVYEAEFHPFIDEQMELPLYVSTEIGDCDDPECPFCALERLTFDLLNADLEDLF